MCQCDNGLIKKIAELVIRFMEGGSVLDSDERKIISVLQEDVAICGYIMANRTYRSFGAPFRKEELDQRKCAYGETDPDRRFKMLSLSQPTRYLTDWEREQVIDDARQHPLLADRKTGRVWLFGVLVTLTKHQRALLSVLLRCKGSVIRDAISDLLSEEIRDTDYQISLPALSQAQMELQRAMDPNRNLFRIKTQSGLLKLLLPSDFVFIDEV